MAYHITIVPGWGLQLYLTPTLSPHASCLPLYCQNCPKQAEIIILNDIQLYILIYDYVSNNIFCQKKKKAREKNHHNLPPLGFTWLQLHFLFTVYCLVVKFCNNIFQIVEDVLKGVILWSVISDVICMCIHTSVKFDVLVTQSQRPKGQHVFAHSLVAKHSG